MTTQTRIAAPAPVCGRTRNWRVGDLEPGDSIIQLCDEELQEIQRCAEHMEAAPLPTVLRHPGQFEIPALRALMVRVARKLDAGTGVVVMDRLPLDALSPAAAIACYWCLGQLLARNVAQKWDGTMLYDVTDTGASFGYGVRGSYTSVELVFHTDNAFGVAPPDYVGLLCLRPAANGGVSRFCSLAAVHDEMLRREPSLLARLYQPMLFDRQAEHAPDAARVASYPMFTVAENRLRVRANPALVRKGYDVAGETMDEPLSAALSLFEECANSPELWFELPLQRGQIQYLDNIDVAHYRSKFVDHDDPALKRHLVRTWHRRGGGLGYDG